MISCFTYFHIPGRLLSSPRHIPGQLLSSPRHIPERLLSSLHRNPGLLPFSPHRIPELLLPVSLPERYLRSSGRRLSRRLR